MHCRAAAALLALVMGCEGPVGQQGLPGAQGPQGTAGQDGDDGTAGADGQVGPGGARGDDGDDGLPASDGEPGPEGRGSYITGPGLGLEIQSFALDEEVATVTFRITDGDGVPLDRDGLYTAGQVDANFVVAWLDVLADDVDEDPEDDPGSYTAYTAVDDEPSADEGGTFTEVGAGSGLYTYELSTPITIELPDRTHTVGAWATREFEGQTYVANAVYSFLPKGGEPTVGREIVTDQTCDRCHGELRAHDGTRRDTRLCILCHQPLAVDTDTGQSLDFRVMVHKIHRGRDLPSVLDGTPYQIVRELIVKDWSTVAFPQEIERCVACHDGADGHHWNENPTRAACGACHDRTSFDDANLPPCAEGPYEPSGFCAHQGGTYGDDDACNACHRPSSGLAPIIGVHSTDLQDPDYVVSLTILDVTETGPGQTPELTFDVEVNGAPRDILAAPLTRLAVTVAGPTTDFASYWQHTIQGSGQSGTLTAEDDHFRYVFPSPMPGDASGSYAVGLEGYLQEQGGARFAAINPVAYFPVTDSEAVARRTVVSLERCNSCHFQLEGHGGTRRNPQYCVMCHNPNNANDDRVRAVEGETVLAQSVRFGRMVHGIHRGDEHAQPYVLGGYPTPNSDNPEGTPVDFGEVRVPRDLRDCGTCHEEGTHRLPLADGLLPAREQTLECTEDPGQDDDAWCESRLGTDSFIAPVSSMCTGCHDAPAAIAHTEINTTEEGVESCATCHDAGSEFDADRFHAPAP